MAYNNLAWIYATSPDARIRNGKEAVMLAIKACELTRYEKAEVLKTLAAAYAEQSAFDKAVEYQQRAIDIASRDTREDYRKLLQLYLSGQAHRSHRSELR